MCGRGDTQNVNDNIATDIYDIINLNQLNIKQFLRKIQHIVSGLDPRDKTVFTAFTHLGQVKILLYPH